MRATPTLFALLLMAAPADAGMRAAYDGTSEPKRLEIETADNGDFRIGPPGDAQYVLNLGGTTYLVSTTPEGPEVVRLDDMAQALGEAMPPFFRDLFTAAARAQPSPPPKVERGGSRNVAGFEGQLYKVTMGSPPETGEFVISSDPGLKPVGTALGGFIETMMVMATPLIGDAAGEMIRDMRGVFALGTPLESKGRFTLVSATQADIPAARLTLPAKPLSAAELARRLKPAAAPTP
jgi:hypothetical protein